ncbi:hypothetical protein FACS189499_04510 [Clostridia bacterium]|nr:hypothetical protein FACS189499_04510 [Clostridia bacterium]
MDDNNININDINSTSVFETTGKQDAEPFTPEIPEERPHMPTEEELAERRKAKRRKKEREARIKEEKKRLQRKTAFHITVSVMLVIAIISVSAIGAYTIINSALDFSGIDVNEFEVDVVIPENATTEEIAAILKENKIITSPEFFTFFSRVNGSDGKYLDGLFSLTSTMTYERIIETLQVEERISETVSVRIREGMTAGMIGKLLEENYVCRAEDFEYFYKNKQNKFNFEKRLLQNSLKFYQLEGYLFPDTYEFYVIDKLKNDPNYDTSEYAAIAANTIYSVYNEKITKEMYKQINERGLNLNQAMTLASMVQAEAATPEDMKMVASVFMNRLKNPEKFPFLQSDVTILYVEENIKPVIPKNSQQLYVSVIKAYNTYETEGIPPGPICNPGMTAIEAVVYAPHTDYFYFCANSDTGEMYFSTSQVEHEAFLKKIEADKKLAAEG